MAKERGASRATLETFAYQAPDFSAKRGYLVFGRLDDYPAGRAKLFLSKRLDASAQMRPAERTQILPLRFAALDRAVSRTLSRMQGRRGRFQLRIGGIQKPQNIEMAAGCVPGEAERVDLGAEHAAEVV